MPLEGKLYYLGMLYPSGTFWPYMVEYSVENSYFVTNALSQLEQNRILGDGLPGSCFDLTISTKKHAL